MPVNSGIFSSAKGTYETPSEIFDNCNTEFQLNFDVCTLPENAKCLRFFTPDDDALKQKWIGRCWMNPPYGRAISQFMQKAYEESQTNAEIAICLVPARTDTAWWHERVMKDEIRFLRKRMRFVGAKSCAPFPSVLVLFRRRCREERRNRDE